MDMVFNGRFMLNSVLNELLQKIKIKNKKSVSLFDVLKISQMENIQLNYKHFKHLTFIKNVINFMIYFIQPF